MPAFCWGEGEVRGHAEVLWKQTPYSYSSYQESDVFNGPTQILQL